MTRLAPSGLSADERALATDLLREITPLCRTIVSDDMDRAMDRVAAAFGGDVVRHRYASGTEHGTWDVPPSWNVREAYLSDGERTLASYRDSVLFVAPYSAPFDGWVPRAELLEHVFSLDDDAFAYQHRVAYDHRKRLRRWEITLPRRVAASLDRDRYYVKIDVDVRPGQLQVLELRAPAATDGRTVALLGHLCHPGQANDGLSGVVAGLILMLRLRRRSDRSTGYVMYAMPETIGSAVHVVAQGLSPERISSAVFLETMGRGERLCLKLSRAGDRPIDLAAKTIARERPEIGLFAFREGFGNDELVFDFPNVAIPSAGVQHYPFRGYHTSADDAAGIDLDLLGRAVDLTEELLRRLENDYVVRFTYPGPPYLSRFALYADYTSERERYARIARVLDLCDGRRTLLEICDASGAPFDEVRAFFDALSREGALERS